MLSAAVDSRPFSPELCLSKNPVSLSCRFKRSLIVPGESFIDAFSVELSSVVFSLSLLFTTSKDRLRGPVCLRNSLKRSAADFWDSDAVPWIADFRAETGLVLGVVLFDSVKFIRLFSASCVEGCFSVGSVSFLLFFSSIFA